MARQLSELGAFVRETAVVAGQLVREKWQQPRQISYKGYQNLVTDADVAAQTLITHRIQQQYPTHGFLPEESDSSLPIDGDLIWIIDPIDGTTNYSRQHPLYCVSIAATRPLRNSANQLTGYEPIAGAVYDPMLDELFLAEKGGGAWLNGRQLRVSQIDTLPNAVICTDWSYNERLQLSSRDVIAPLAHELQGARCLGTASLGMAWVAAGRFDAYLNYNLQPWDIAAAYLIIAEAGGRVTHVNGRSLNWLAAGLDTLASNSLLHPQLVNILPHSRSGKFAPAHP